MKKIILGSLLATSIMLSGCAEKTTNEYARNTYQALNYPMISQYESYNVGKAENYDFEYFKINPKEIKNCPEKTTLIHKLYAHDFLYVKEVRQQFAYGKLNEVKSVKDTIKTGEGFDIYACKTNDSKEPFEITYEKVYYDGPKTGVLVGETLENTTRGYLQNH